jgi:2-keto-myo-inositol isomerase
VFNRRQVLTVLGSTAASLVVPIKARSQQSFQSSKNTFNFCLNMATLRGHKLGFIKELEIASKAGFTMVEIWINSLQQHLQEGGKINDVRSRLNDLGITVANSIGFAKWIVDDEDT